MPPCAQRPPSSRTTWAGAAPEALAVAPMPRRALLLITALVLVLHALVLGGLPLRWDGPRGPVGAVFSTRSIAPPPVAAAPQPPPPAARAPAPRPPKPRPTPTPPPPPAAEPAGEFAPAAEPTTIAEAAPTEATAAPDQPPAGEPAQAAASEPASPASAPASAPVEPPAAVASAPMAPASTPPPEDPGVDIVPPGGGTGHPGGSTPPPVKIPAPTRLSFDVSGQAKRFNYSARAELVWKHDGNRYEARQEISAFLLGTRAQTSVGQVTERGLLPTRFGDKVRSEQAAHFDFAQGRVTFSANTPSAAIAPGAQDRLSVFIQLSAMLAADPGRYPMGTEITLTTVGPRAADRWTFRVEGAETLELPVGTTPTLKLARLPRRDFDQQAELWLAPALQYLPVRIRLSQANGDFADLRLHDSSAP